MTPKEQEIAIGELEERVDRLRNIYEQYFLGFEKLEPTVPRKDVDRRFAILRKEQIRNTAMRFRFQVVTQKFYTYSMHWVRICRQIEDGTYKRHLRKAKARFGDTAERPVEEDASIDIELGDFDDEDLDSLLAEIDAPAATPESQQPPQHKPERELVLPTPGTSFAVAGHREDLGEIERTTPPPLVRSPADRALRGAALPAGARPRVLLRRRDDGDASLRPGPSLGSGPALPAGPPAAPIPSPPGSSQHLPPAPPSRPQLDVTGARPSGPRIVLSPAAPPATLSAGPPAAGRIPVAPPLSSGDATSSGRIPAAPPARASAGRLPLPAPVPPPPSAGRWVAAPPPPARQAAPPPPSFSRLPPATSPKLDVARRPSVPTARAADKDAPPPSTESPQSARSRPPVPLPSQSTRPPMKKE